MRSPAVSTIKTFHAFGAMLLRQHAERLGLSPEFVILAEDDRAALLRQACPELKTAEVDAALAQISAAKNEAYAGDRIGLSTSLHSGLKSVTE